MIPNQHKIRQARDRIGINQDVKALFDFHANILHCYHPKAGADQCNGQNCIPFNVMRGTLIQGMCRSRVGMWAASVSSDHRLQVTLHYRHDNTPRPPGPCV